MVLRKASGGRGFRLHIKAKQSTGQDHPIFTISHYLPLFSIPSLFTPRHWGKCTYTTLTLKSHYKFKSLGKKRSFLYHTHQITKAHEQETIFLVFLISSKLLFHIRNRFLLTYFAGRRNVIQIVFTSKQILVQSPYPSDSQTLTLSCWHDP